MLELSHYSLSKWTNHCCHHCSFINRQQQQRDKSYTQHHAAAVEEHQIPRCRAGQVWEGVIVVIIVNHHHQHHHDDFIDIQQRQRDVTYTQPLVVVTQGCHVGCSACRSMKEGLLLSPSAATSFSKIYQYTTASGRHHLHPNACCNNRRTPSRLRGSGRFITTITIILTTSPTEDRGRETGLTFNTLL